MSTPFAQRFTTVAVITGGCGGMGLTCAHELGRHHALVLADVNAQRLEEAANELQFEGCAVTTVVGDVADPVWVGRLAERARALGPVRALVHAAGTSVGDWRSILAVNYVGAALMAEAFLPLADKGSAAVFVASIAAHRVPRDSRLDRLFEGHRDLNFLDRFEAGLGGAPTLARAYELSKHGVLRLCERSAALWGARGARIVSISPGYIYTPMTAPHRALMEERVQKVPLGRWGMPLDIAAAVAFLCSDQASFISGTDLRIDGGLATDIGPPAQS